MRIHEAETAPHSARERFAHLEQKISISERLHVTACNVGIAVAELTAIGAFVTLILLLA